MHRRPPLRLLLVGPLLAALASAVRADDWPQWLGTYRDGVWRETGILTKFPQGGPKVIWRVPIAGGFSGPAVADGRIYVMDREGDEVKKGSETPGKDGLKSKERVLCLDAKDGKELWKHEYDCLYKVLYPSGPRTTPVVKGGYVWTLGSMGDICCLEADSGKLVWTKNLPKEYNTKPPLWGYSAHLLVDGDKVISLCGGDGSAVVALNKLTGEELWKALMVEEVGYAPPMIFEAGEHRQLIVFHTEAVNALDPESGQLFWSQKFPGKPPERPGITVATPKKSGDLLYLTEPHHGSLMLKFLPERPAVDVVWRSKENASLSKTDGLHALMSTPVVKDGYVYGVCSFGELRCVNAQTGERIWETYDATSGKKQLFANAFLVPQGERFWIFNDHGDLILADLSPKGYKEIDRAHIIEPTLTSRGREVVWCHPAFANKCLYVRNDKELICISLAGSRL